MGSNQSPIRVEKTIHSPELKPIKFYYNEKVVKLSTVNQVIPRVQPAPGNKLVAMGETWDLEDFLLRSPAEHVIGHNDYDVEIQLRHRNEKGQLLIVSVFANEGRNHRDIQRMIKSLGPRRNEIMTLSGFDFRLLLPRRKGYLTYNGSETFPPCEEGVRWVILKDHISLSPKQIDLIQSYFGKNNRPTQMIGSRVVLTN